jgi:hypothetical protein
MKYFSIFIFLIFSSLCLFGQDKGADPDGSFSDLSVLDDKLLKPGPDLPANLPGIIRFPNALRIIPMIIYSGLFHQMLLPTGLGSTAGGDCSYTKAQTSIRVGMDISITMDWHRREFTYGMHQENSTMDLLSIRQAM